MSKEKAICLNKVKDKNGKIVYYDLQNIDNMKKVRVDTDTLKREIKKDSLEVINLTLTKDNRLVSTKSNKPRKTDTYYRYVLKKDGKEVGGIFRGLNTLINELYNDEGNTQSWEDYEDLNRLLGEIEYILPFPTLQETNIDFYYTELGKQKAINTIRQLEEIVEYYNYIVEEKTKVGYRNLVYYDVYQIAEKGKK